MSVIKSTALDPEIVSLKVAGYAVLVTFDQLNPLATELLFRGTCKFVGHVSSALHTPSYGRPHCI